MEIAWDNDTYVPLWNNSRIFFGEEYTIDFAIYVNYYQHSNGGAENGFVTVPLSFRSVDGNPMKIVGIEGSYGIISSPLSQDTDMDGLSDTYEFKGWRNIIDLRERTGTDGEPYVATYGPVELFERDDVLLTSSWEYVEKTLNTTSYSDGFRETFVNLRFKPEDTGEFRLGINMYMPYKERNVALPGMDTASRESSESSGEAPSISPDLNSGLSTETLSVPADNSGSTIYGGALNAENVQTSYPTTSSDFFPVTTGNRKG